GKGEEGKRRQRRQVHPLGNLTSGGHHHHDQDDDGEDHRNPTVNLPDPVIHRCVGVEGETVQPRMRITKRSYTALPKPASRKLLTSSFLRKKRSKRLVYVPPCGF